MRLRGVVSPATLRPYSSISKLERQFSSGLNKVMKIYRQIVLMMLVIGLALAHSAKAQQGKAQQALTISQLLIQLWPEYDQPSMLAQYTGQMNVTDEVSL